MSDDIDWDALITLEEAAHISGLSLATLRYYAVRGILRTEPDTARRQFHPHKGGTIRNRRHLTTRRWLHEYLTNRRAVSGAIPPKPLPTDYVAPPGSDEREQ